MHQLPSAVPSARISGACDSQSPPSPTQWPTLPNADLRLARHNQQYDSPSLSDTLTSCLPGHSGWPMRKSSRTSHLRLPRGHIYSGPSALQRLRHVDTRLDRNANRVLLIPSRASTPRVSGSSATRLTHGTCDRTVYPQQQTALRLRAQGSGVPTPRSIFSPTTPPTPWHTTTRHRYGRTARSRSLPHGKVRKRTERSQSPRAISPRWTSPCSVSPSVPRIPVFPPILI